MMMRPSERRTVTPFAMSPGVALLALALTLLGFFAVHSEITGHDAHVAAPASATAAGSLGGAAVAAAGAAGSADLTFMTASPHGGATDCALLALACVLLLVLVTVVVLTRRPALYNRLLDAGGARGLIRAVAAYIHRPSLIFLSISRV